LYFDKSSRDFGLLMDLLAESSGIVQSLRILAMFDKQFQKLWNTTDVQIHMERKDDLEHLFDEENPESEETSIVVTWNDCDMAEYFCQHNPSTILEYTVEITPETEIPIKSFQYYKSLHFTPMQDLDFIDKSTSLSPHATQKYSTRFDGLTPSSTYMIHISTELDGKTVVQTKHQFKTLQQNQIETAETKS